MKLIDQPRTPNPRRVRIFLAEKGISVPSEMLDLMQSQQKTADFAMLNPYQAIPVLVLDDGTTLSESVAICRYFEELHPQPALFGTGALDRANVEMWNRRMEHGLFFCVTQAFRHLIPAMAAMESPQMPEWGQLNKSRIGDQLRLLDRQLSKHPFVAGDRFSIADITALTAVDFSKPLKVERPPGLVNLDRWYGEVSARPSAKA
jgi:glutathione S-transferase